MLHKSHDRSTWGAVAIMIGGAHYSLAGQSFPAIYDPCTDGIRRSNSCRGMCGSRDRSLLQPVWIHRSGVQRFFDSTVPGDGEDKPSHPGSHYHRAAILQRSPEHATSGASVGSVPGTLAADGVPRSAQHRVQGKHPSGCG